LGGQHVETILANSNFEIRQRQWENVSSIFKSAISIFTENTNSSSYSTSLSAFLSMQYAYFLQHIRGDVNEARQIYEEAVERGSTKNLWLAYIHFELNLTNAEAKVEKVYQLYQRALDNESKLYSEEKAEITANLIDFLSQFSSDVKTLRKVIKSERERKRTSSKKRSWETASGPPIPTPSQQTAIPPISVQHPHLQLHQPGLVPTSIPPTLAGHNPVMPLLPSDPSLFQPNKMARTGAPTAQAPPVAPPVPVYVPPTPYPQYIPQYPQPYPTQYGYPYGATGYMWPQAVTPTANPTPTPTPTTPTTPVLAQYAAPQYQQYPQPYIQ